MRGITADDKLKAVFGFTRSPETKQSNQRPKLKRLKMVGKQDIPEQVSREVIAPRVVREKKPWHL